MVREGPAWIEDLTGWFCVQEYHFWVLVVVIVQHMPQHPILIMKA